MIQTKGQGAVLPVYGGGEIIKNPAIFSGHVSSGGAHSADRNDTQAPSGSVRRLSYYFDEDVIHGPIVAEELRRRGVDALTALGAGRAGQEIPDREQLGPGDLTDQTYYCDV